VGARLDPADIGDLGRMLHLLETMAVDVYESLSRRNVERALEIFRTDAELDRIRNLVLIRHLEAQSITKVADAIHVVAMAQCLERAGDHMKNLAEEICHLVSGHSVRHLLRARDRSNEQMYIEHMRKRILSAD
jgi:phosphate transport system protein